MPGNPYAETAKYFDTVEEAGEYAESNLGDDWSILSGGRYGFNQPGKYVVTSGNAVSGVVEGNPGHVPLHETLADAANFVDYEAEVVRTAAENMPPSDAKTEALQQANAMDTAADKLQNASEQAAETAAEVFNETGVPSVEQKAEIVAGNPLGFSNVQPEHERTGKQWSDAVDFYIANHKASGLSDIDAHYRARAFASWYEVERIVTGRDLESAMATYERSYPVVDGNPQVAQTNAPQTRQNAAKSLQQGVGAPGSHSGQPGHIVAGNPVGQPGSRSGQAGQSPAIVAGNPTETVETLDRLIAKAYADQLDYIRNVEGATEGDGVDSFYTNLIAEFEKRKARITVDGNPVIAGVTPTPFTGVSREAAQGGANTIVAGNPVTTEEIVAAETVTDDEDPVTQHWYFKKWGTQ